MKVIMDDLRLDNLKDLHDFLQGSKSLVLRLQTIEEKYNFIDETIDKFDYVKLKKKDKKIVLKYLKKLTGYKKAQLTRLVSRASLGDLVRQKYQRSSETTNRIYLPSDIKLLEKTDEYHLRLSSHATQEILRREYEVFHKIDFKNISNVSISHIDNLRKNPVYKSTWVNGTKAREVDIGTTMKPETNNLPGSIRVDTVHQRDIFYINAVDEIVQWEVTICVPQICEKYLKPAFELLLYQFPFTIFNFHSDRGGEFINKIVSQILNRLLINQTKSRSRHCNDNALVESKNGSIIRKNMGYFHMSKKIVDETNDFLFNWFNLYLNYHRPCGYVTETKIDFKGRERNVYGEYTTPYEKLKQISKEKKINFLKKGQSFEKLDIIAYGKSDNDFAKEMREKQNKLFNLNLKMF